VHTRMIYDFICQHCNKVDENVYLKISHEDWEHPYCCGREMQHHITKAPSVRWKDAMLLDGGFIAHSMPGKPVITSQKQNREMMKRHNLVDANDLGPPPTKADQMEQHHKDQAQMAEFEPPEHVKQEMKRQGLDSIVE
jgi:hypothetical protein